MTYQFVSLHRLDLSHDKMVGLSKAGYLRLALNEELTDSIARIRKNLSIPVHLSMAEMIWEALAILGMILSIVLMFVVAWWFGLACFAACFMLRQANLDLKPERLLEAGLNNEEFYNQVKKIGGWLYEVEERVALFLTLHPVVTDDLQQAHDIAGDFALCMEKNTEKARVFDLSLLPHDKETIRDALIKVFHDNNDHKIKTAARRALISLALYQPDVGPTALDLALRQAAVNEEIDQNLARLNA